MPKFHVTMVKEVWEKATVVVDAANETAAELAAKAVALSDETIEWRHEETHALDVIDIQVNEETAA